MAECAAWLELGLPERFARALLAMGWSHPTRIQRGAMPLLSQGQDGLLQAPTGSGKTGAFLVPLLMRSRALEPQPAKPLVLVVTPTRELAEQIGEVANVFCRQADLPGGCEVVVGGVGPQGQANRLAAAPLRLLVATPGRLLDLLERKAVDLSGVAHLVLDEADELLSMGFEEELTQIIEVLPGKRQSVLVSATLGAGAERIGRMALDRPARLSVAGAPGIGRAECAIAEHLWRVHPKNKLTLLEHLLHTTSTGRVLVFTATRHDADWVAKMLRKAGFEAGGLHGDLSQARRRQVLEKLAADKLHIVVATDLAARGLDFSGVTMVVHHSLPDSPESWVHRNGRLVRGKDDNPEDAVVHAFCCGDDKGKLASLQQSLGKKLKERTDHPEYTRENDVDATFRRPDAEVVARRKQRSQQGGAQAAKQRLWDGKTPRKGDRPGKGRGRRK